MQLTVTEAAIKHFRRLIENENVPGMNLRVFVANPGTIEADIGITFCPPEEEEKGDIPLHFEDFHLFVEEASRDALREAILDYEEDPAGGQLSVKAPYLKGKKPAADSPLTERIEFVLNTEINPTLAGHGGKVSLVEYLEGGIVVLRFGGGCHGCGMANITLKHGIEKTLKERFAEITEIRDITDHAAGENPYY